MAIDSVYARLAELAELAERTQAPGSSPTAPEQIRFGPETARSFSDVLNSLAGYPVGDQRSLAAVGQYGVAAAPQLGYGGSAGQRALAVAASEVGHAEVPPGSNDGPRIDQYRSAVAGSYRGAPWCAYFVSYAAAQAGTPIGHGGTGLGSVAGIEQWGRETGRLLPPGAAPVPGDVVLYGHDHAGIVEAVHPDGSLTTIEGNHEDAVTRVLRDPGEATGFVRL